MHFKLNKTLKDHCKEAGLDSVTEASERSLTSKRTLDNWLKNAKHRKRLKLILFACNAEKQNEVIK